MEKELAKYPKVSEVPYENARIELTRCVVNRYQKNEVQLKYIFM